MLLCPTTATVATEEPEAPDRMTAEDKFWRIYWGEVVMVEDEDVAKAVDASSNVLYDQPKNGVGLLNASMNIACACRESLGETWKVQQRPLPAVSKTRSRKVPPK
jgi:hypothetical protein